MDVFGVMFSFKETGTNTFDLETVCDYSHMDWCGHEKIFILRQTHCIGFTVFARLSNMSSILRLMDYPNTIHTLYECLPNDTNGNNSSVR